MVRPIVFDGKRMGTVYIRSDVQELFDRVRNYLAILAGILIISLGAALLVSRMSQQVISKPIVTLAETAQAISRDQNYSVRATPIANRDEIAVLIDSFNKMLMKFRNGTRRCRRAKSNLECWRIPFRSWLGWLNPMGTSFGTTNAGMSTPEPRRSR